VSQCLWKYKRDIIHHYNRIAGIYDSLYGEEQKAKIESILRIIKGERKDLVLDAGCGTGLLIEYLASKVDHFVGLDISEKVLKVALDKSRRLKIKGNVSLIRADIDILPFRDSVFDKIFALTLLQNVPEPHKTLREMIRVAKKNSLIAVTGLKKHFTKKSFSEVISEISQGYVFAEPLNIHDFIAIFKMSKVKDKYG